MNIALREGLTVSEYLAWADAQAEPPRTELYNGQTVPMPPERAIHNRVKRAADRALTRAVETAGLTCEVFGDGMTVPIDAYTAYGPDVVVNCAEAIPDNQLTVPNPIIVVEVSSPTTAHTDRSAKLVGYFKVASVRHYLIVDTDARTVTRHRRGDDGQIVAETHASGALQLDPPGLAVAIEEIFE